MRERQLILLDIKENSKKEIRIFSGESPDWCGSLMGEIVFNTSMVGYVESMTDPSYRGQVLVFSIPRVGNYGISLKDSWESSSIQVAGVVVQHCSKAFEQWCQDFNIPLLLYVDTRALIKTIRGKSLSCCFV